MTSFITGYILGTLLWYYLAPGSLSKTFESPASYFKYHAFGLLITGTLYGLWIKW